MRQHVIDQPLEHHEDVRLAGAVRINRDREDRIMHPVELVLPDFLERASGDPAVTVSFRLVAQQNHREQENGPVNDAADRFRERRRLQHAAHGGE